MIYALATADMIIRNFLRAYWLSAALVNCSMLTLAERPPLAVAASVPVNCSRARRSSLVRVFERMGRKGAGEPAEEVRN